MANSANGLKGSLAKEMFGALTGSHKRLAWILPAIFLLIGLIFRLWELNVPFTGVQSWNEAYYTLVARNMSHFGILSSFGFDVMREGAALGHVTGPTPLVPSIISFSSRVFGNSEWAARIPFLIFGLSSLGLVFLIAKELYDKKVANGALLISAIMPGLAFFSRQISLDSPMAAFGLASLWMLLVAKRTRRYRWLVASSIVFGMAIAAKYTAVLFLPALAVIWVGMLRSGFLSRHRRWLIPLGWLAVALLPAVLWFLRDFKTASAQGLEGPVSYISRFSEWTNLRTWLGAILVIWKRTSEQIGFVFFYPLVFISAGGVINGKIRKFLWENRIVVLLAAAWYAQVLYPASWIVNDGYIYPGLYGVALLLGYLAKLGFQYARPRLAPSGRRAVLGVVLITGIVTLACALDYWQTYESWHMRPNKINYPDTMRPVNLVTPEDPFLSARTVRNMNQDNKPVLADLPQTVLYAVDEYWDVRAVWFWSRGVSSSKKLIAAIRSRDYEFIVFAYQPPIDVVEAIGGSRYRRIAPAAWQKAPEDP